jgi:hypothetical protein
MPAHRLAFEDFQNTSSTVPDRVLAMLNIVAPATAACYKQNAF